MSDWRCVGIALYQNGIMSGSVLSGYVFMVTNSLTIQMGEVRERLRLNQEIIHF